ncbi:MAG TPA: NADH-quinone oxidoreductase subunit NuoF [Thermodesulfobacteriota bacterium]|nr:NADH-quinone oxidoreductase subunit NuoF [Deltaproteobacteria bacterium]HNR13718.1 NADH-quinone oxidoreductase subunit NuoF [Thermodesulfobacteriota bacterium]HNU70161.1 NADH-quinone oxidoreductase subunit NuoF [Thermodesulfobacteriota bacterium]
MNEQVRERIAEISMQYTNPEAAVLAALQEAQKSGGYLQQEDMAEVASILKVPLSAVFASCSYYSMLNRKPVGKYHIEIDTNIPAMLAGSGELLAHVEKRLGIRAGETTKDGLFTLSTVEDLGACGTCPVIQVGDRYFEEMTPEKADELIESLRRNEIPESKSKVAVGGDRKVLLRRVGRPDSTTISSYIEDGGYQALKKALTMKPADVTSEVKASGLRGRGGAGFPAGVKWGFLPKDSVKPVYLICNADEGEPGTFKDRQIMEYDPHLLLEGMAIAGYAIGAKRGFIYIRGEFAWIADILERAVKEARSSGKLGKNILGTSFDFDISIHRGAGAYVCGEETALIESLEGKRGNPRVRPPFPAVSGLFGCPTIVNNVETLSLVPFIIEKGEAAFREIGTLNNFGPKLFGVSGHVQRPGVYEFPLGTPLCDILEAAGSVKGKLKAIIPGGLSTAVLTAEELGDCTIPMDYDNLLKRGTALGSGGIIVMNDTVSMPAIALRTIQFYAHESCGQCTPCREGSSVIRALLAKLIAGKGTPEDIEIMLDLTSAIKGTTICPTGEAFCVPIEAMIRKFRSEFDALVQQR